MKLSATIRKLDEGWNLGVTVPTLEDAEELISEHGGEVPDSQVNPSPETRDRVNENQRYNIRKRQTGQYKVSFYFSGLSKATEYLKQLYPHFRDNIDN